MTDASPDDDLAADDDMFWSGVAVNRRSWGILNSVYRLLGRQSVTRSWVRETNPRIEFNFDNLTLSGVGFGRGLNELSLLGLGPADEKYGEGCRSLSYDDLGLCITASDDEGIYCIEIQWWDFGAYKPFPGECLVHGRAVPLTKDTDRKAILDYFGKPSDVTDEEDFSSVEYEVAGGEFTIVFDDEGTLSFVDVTRTD